MRFLFSEAPKFAFVSGIVDSNPESLSKDQIQYLVYVDTSMSMSGDNRSKMVGIAMSEILSKIKVEELHVKLFTFNDIVTHQWDSEDPATKGTEVAKLVSALSNVRGATNYLGVVDSIKSIIQINRSSNKSPELTKVIFITDGEPTRPDEARVPLETLVKLRSTIECEWISLGLFIKPEKYKRFLEKFSSQYVAVNRVEDISLAITSIFGNQRKPVVGSNASFILSPASGPRILFGSRHPDLHHGECLSLVVVCPEDCDLQVAFQYKPLDKKQQETVQLKVEVIEEDNEAVQRGLVLAAMSYLDGDSVSEEKRQTLQKLLDSKEGHTLALAKEVQKTLDKQETKIETENVIRGTVYGEASRVVLQQIHSEVLEVTLPKNVWIRQCFEWYDLYGGGMDELIQWDPFLSREWTKWNQSKEGKVRGEEGDDEKKPKTYRFSEEARKAYEELSDAFKEATKFPVKVLRLARSYSKTYVENGICGVEDPKDDFHTYYAALVWQICKNRGFLKYRVKEWELVEILPDEASQTS